MTDQDPQVEREFPVPLEEVEELKEITQDDLVRLAAEYANYRKRTTRDIEKLTKVVQAKLLLRILPLVDELERAKEHGELSPTLTFIDKELVGIFADLGVYSFGEVGDTFDVNLHEALTHTESSSEEEPTCILIYQLGWAVGNHVLRPAKVGVGG